MTKSQNISNMFAWFVKHPTAMPIDEAQPLITGQTIGPQLPQPDPRGVLVFEWLPADIQAAEDATQAADLARYVEGYPFASRPPTPAEYLLLQHLGYDIGEALRVHGTFTTVVDYRTAGVRCRYWPELKDQTP